MLTARPVTNAAASTTRRRVAVAIVVAVVVLDQLTKASVVATLSDHPLSIIGDTVELRVSRNTGSAFSFLAGGAFTPLLAVVAIAVAVGLVRFLRHTDDTWGAVGLALVLGGALGNLIDRFARSPGVLRGAVVDFVHVGWFPSFNVADSAITVGAVLVVVGSWRRAPPGR